MLEAVEPISSRYTSTITKLEKSSVKYWWEGHKPSVLKGEVPIINCRTSWLCTRCRFHYLFSPGQLLEICRRWPRCFREIKRPEMKANLDHDVNKACDKIRPGRLGSLLNEIMCSIRADSKLYYASQVQQNEGVDILKAAKWIDNYA